MLRPGLNSMFIVLALCWIATSAMRGEAVQAVPDYREVRELIGAHLPGVTDADLDRATVLGMVSKLAPRVSLLTPGSSNAAGGEASGPLLSKTSVVDDGVIYVRVARVEDGLAEAVRQACQPAGVTNTPKGVVIDLRFAGGGDYAAASTTADLFVKSGQPLLDWGGGMVVAKEKSEVIGLPVAVLVNQRTAGAAEALAAVLRKAGNALILGGKTAGEAMMAQEYPLANGDRLRIATKPIQLGDGSVLADGVEPDIAIRINPAEERAFYDNPFKLTAVTNLAAAAGARPGSAGDTNAPRRPRLNEKELVREHLEGLNGDVEFPTVRLPAAAGPGSDAEKPQVRDPALARAIDVLKGLAVFRAARS